MKILKRFFLAALLAAGCAQASWAIGAYPRPLAMRQPDGTTLMVRIHGDENFNYVTTLDGFLLEKDQKGYFCYVDYDLKSGRKTLTHQRAHNTEVRTDKEVRLLKQLTSAREASADMLQRRPVGRKAPLNILSPEVTAPRKVHGAKAPVKESEYLVILVNFQDVAMKHTKEEFDNWLNQPGYSENGGTGSVKDYYRDNSAGQFIPNFTVVGPYTLSQPLAYYGAADEDGNVDVNPRAMVQEALDQARKEHSELNFKQFDNDGNGVMDNCYVIYAGYSQASTANTDDIWPHSWYLEDGYLVDGVQVKDYSCSAELVGMPGAPVLPSMDGIGTFTHEFGHVLGLCDMYDTSSNENLLGVDPGDYSLYASGSYNNDSRTPAGLMAFERLQMGWMTVGKDLVELQGAEDVTLGKLADNTARFINCQPDRKVGTGVEWFILENRQQEGWDTYIPAHGLLITHYDYTDEMKEEYWDVNGPNNNMRHRCMYIVPADGIDDATTRSGDTYPGKTANTAFTSETTPAAVNWDNEPLNVPVTNIMEKDGNILFQVAGGTSRWNFIKTLVPTGVLDTRATFEAKVESSDQEVTEIGFCWKVGANAMPTLKDLTLTGKAGHGKVEDLNQPVYTAENLKAGETYSVRSYMKMADGQVVYGSPVPFSTEWARYEVTLDDPFYCNFLTWTGNQPEGWEILDNNTDGTTWIQDESANAIRYSFNYWNDADDYLISRRRFRVPEHGALFFTRGVTETTGVEDLEVLVSTRTSQKDDFHLVKRFSFADYFGEQHMEEVDLSQFAGKDVYVAFRACSERMQNDLWLWNVLMTQKLDTPQEVKLERTGEEALTASWSAVEGADNYYLTMSKETAKTNTQVLFTPMSFYENVQGDVTLGTGSIWFKGTGSVTLKDCPEGLQDCKFIVLSSGPLGTSELNIEGTEDGKTWKAVGAKIYLDTYDSEGQEMDYTPYLENKKFRQLRFNFKNGGRLARIKYLTVSYTDGKVYEDVAAGSVASNEIVIASKQAGEYNEGKYRIWVAAGHGNIYYDESQPAYYDYAASTAIEDVIEGSGVSLRVQGGRILATGLRPGQVLTLTTLGGATLYTGVAQSESLNIPLTGVQGVVLVGVTEGGKTQRTKILVGK